MYPNNLKHVGNIAVIRAMKHFAEHGFSLLIPMGDYQKYDLVVEKDNKFYRIQCKTTRKPSVHLTSSASINDYLIPVNELLARKHLGMIKKHDKYKVYSNQQTR